jgi:hypothetical protein
MSAVALILNALLGVLLLAALGLGWRLERRLRALRDSQTAFTQAVEDLDRAASRAEQGLADLRAATDEAADSLAGRIERAQQLASRLDSAFSRAPAPASNAFTSGTTIDAARARADLRVPPRDVRTDLILEDDEPARRPFSASRLEAALAATRPAAAPSQPLRSRARIDDDLFDEAAPPRMRLGTHR